MAGERFVIIGGGLAGAKAAETLRDQGFDGEVVLFAGEPELPYERPPLSKGYLTGGEDRSVIYVHGDASWYDDRAVELHTNTCVTSLDVADHRLALGDGSTTAFDKALLATGASPRILAVPGAELAGVHYLRRAGDADALRTALADGGRRVVIVGGGWIGLEVASAARGYGNEVTVVEPQPTVLKGALGELGDVFAALHRDHGVRVVLGQGVAQIVGAEGRVAGVVTESGERRNADVVVVGVGARPNVDLAEAAGLAVDNGVLVDAALRTSHPDVFAAGDVANWLHPTLGRRVRVEHWDNARKSGEAAARSMLGEDVSYDHLPFFFTDQYDLGMEYTGSIGPDGFDDIVVRGDRDARQFIAFWLKNGAVVAGMNVNVWDVSDSIKALIRSGAAIDVSRLADSSVPLQQIAEA